MSDYLEALQLKRQKAAESDASRKTHSESIDAVKGSGREIVGATASLAKSQDIDSLIQQVKEVQLASMLGASKPSVVLTDQTDLGDKIVDLSNKLASTVKELDSSEVDKKQLTQLVTITTALTQLKSSQLSSDKETQKSIAILAKSVSALKLNPNISVPAPKVTVESPKLDLSPITKAIERSYQVPEVEKFDLSCYRAQDINNATPGLQYIGFVNPDGNWYIIENDVRGNKLRYVFGDEGYTEAFAKAASYTYFLLNEAVNALKA